MSEADEQVNKTSADVDKTGAKFIETGHYEVTNRDGNRFNINVTHNRRANAFIKAGAEVGVPVNVAAFSNETLRLAGREDELTESEMAITIPIAERGDEELEGKLIRLRQRAHEIEEEEIRNKGYQ